MALSTASELISPDPALRRVGWAGLLFDCPRSFRFARLEGDADQGKLILADDHRQRLEFAWARVRSDHYDGLKFARKRLARVLRIKDVTSQLAEVANEHYKPLLYYRDPQDKLDRYAGYCPASRRVIEIAYHAGNAAEDRLIRQYLGPGLIDQNIRQPTRWSFFDVSFIAPPGYRYESARLNLGDMRVRLIAGSRRWNGPRLTIGQIYPAELALKRQDLPQWVRSLAAEIRSHYRPAKGKTLNVHTWEAEGESIAQADLVLRRRFRPFLWSTPRPLRLYVIHHHVHNRLTFINISHRVHESMDEHFQFIRESLHWAGLSS